MTNFIKPTELGSNRWMSDAQAGEVVANVRAISQRSYDALPDIFACCYSTDFPEDFSAGVFETVLLVIHAQTMSNATVLALDKVLASQPLTKEDISALSWSRSAAESLAAMIERLRNQDHLWVPAEVERAAKPVAGEVPF